MTSDDYENELHYAAKADREAKQLGYRVMPYRCGFCGRSLERQNILPQFWPVGFCGSLCRYGFHSGCTVAEIDEIRNQVRAKKGLEPLGPTPPPPPYLKEWLDKGN